MTLSLSKEAKQTQAVEQLPISDRIQLVTAGLKIIRGWPESFLNFADETGISRTHFNGAECLQPTWMNELIDSRLAKQNRSVTGAVLETAISNLSQKLDRSPTKTELRRHLAWQGDKGLGEFFRKRTKGTSSEWLQFLNAVTEIEHRLTQKARSKTAFACDMAVLLLCLLNDVQMNSFAEVQRKDLLGLLEASREQLDPSEVELQLLSIRIEGLLDGIPNWPGSSNRISIRQVRARLRQLMIGLPSELVFDVRAFRHLQILCAADS